MYAPRALQVLGLLTVWSDVASVNLLAFDCRRTGTHDCVQGTCGTTQKGVCQCNNGFLSYDCSHDSSTAGNGCGTKCGPNSHCKSDNSCLCPETHYNGKEGTCEYKTLQHKCSVSGKILLNVNIPSVERLEVFVGKKESTCLLQSDGSTSHPAMPEDWKGKVGSVDVPSDSDCGAARVSNINGLKRTCVTVFIKLNRLFDSALDGVVDFCCQGGTVDNVNVGGVEPLISTTPKPTTTTSTSFPLRSSISLLLLVVVVHRWTVVTVDW